MTAIGVMAVGLCVGGRGLAASATPNGPSFYHLLVNEVMQTLGATPIPCSDVGVNPTRPDERSTCARLPGLMFGYFKMGVHGRLYAYLEQGTLRVQRPWSFTGTTLNIAYGLGHDDVLTIARVWSGGALYAVFTYAPAKTAVQTVLAPGRR